MVDLYVPAPSYQPPDFSWVGSLPNAFYQGAQQKQQYDQSRAFQNGLPTDPQGNPDYRAIAQTLAKTGNVQNLPQLEQLALEQKQLQAAQQPNPMLAGIGGPAATVAPQGQPSTPQPATPLNSNPPASAAAAIPTTPQGGAGNGTTVTQLVSTALPEAAKSGVVARNIAAAIKAQPDAPLTPEQSAKAQKLLNGYLTRTGQAQTNGNNPTGMGDFIARERQIESGGNSDAISPTGAKGPDQFTDATWRRYGHGSPFDPKASAQATEKLASDNATVLAKSLGRQPTEAELYLAHQQGAAGAARLLANPNVPAGRLVSPQAIRANGGDPNAPASQFTAMWEQRFNRTSPIGQGQSQQGNPIVPQVPLPTGFTDPQRAILALDREMAQLSTNPYAKGQVAALQDWRDRIAASTSPMKVGQSDTYVDPRNGKVLFQGPAAKGYASETGGTLDADAARYLQTGTLPPNMGRGMQGAAQATAIRQRADQMAIDQHIDPSTLPARWQQYKAHQVGITRFQSGPQGNAVRSFNVLVDHLGTLEEASSALQNGNVRAFNQVGNMIAEQTGKPAPTNFNATKALVGDEIVKAVVGGGGALGDREEVKKAIDAANSPAQLAGVIEQYKKLALGQLRGLEQQYKTSTGLDNFNDMLLPGTRSFFGGHEQVAQAGQSGQSGPPHVATKAQYDALSHGAKYIAPDGSVRTKS